MLNNYRIYRRKQELGRRITRLHNTEQLAVGILDTGSLEQLTSCLDWYTSEMNFSLHVVTQEGRFDLTGMQEAYKDVTFLVFTSHTFTGEKVNAVANECRTNLFLIVRSDLLLVKFDGPALLDAMAQSDHPAAFAAVVANAYREIIPCRRMPRLVERELDPDSGFPSLEESVSLPSLYPFMCLGLYDRALFQRLRGFDEAIHSEYWQALDWGLRCHLLGYTVAINSALMMQFPDRESVIEDRSEAEGYLRCYTKALSVQQINTKNLARKYKGFVDKDVYQTEVKKRMLWLQKLDFAGLCARWPKEDV
ncbi:hypothetical protein SAMN06298221_11724 [Sphaerochaeta associata]|uniref:Glycosyl transferase family 2 n=1 Tax=Sphaerochaeta associata TaxID=1129264 RepID=A0ABY4D6G0_9SPIR|nr:hypothetical protein [Sphaerochaeta associata]UOM49883.1 hypothetical protein MUG09_09970 [Sphaerochaeta associata]SMP64469.1 hypothetical protein SAMN06298221_11724 [Sphaerochaeta associata]